MFAEFKHAPELDRNGIGVYAVRSQARGADQGFATSPLWMPSLRVNDGRVNPVVFWAAFAFLCAIFEPD